MIRIILGNVGSGKTAFQVREMYHNPQRRTTYSNIKTPLPNVVQINPNMIITNEIVDHKKNRKTGETEPVYKQSLNIDFWKNIKEPINVTLDEAHSILNSRRSMSKTNIIITDWLSLIRRILGETQSGYGTLTFITQLPKRIDIIARDMARNVVYCVMHYKKECEGCNAYWQENSEMPEEIQTCPSCGSIDIIKTNHTMEVWHFANMEKYEMWNEMYSKSFYKHYYIKDISRYFSSYDTLQWDNLFSEFY